MTPPEVRRFSTGDAAALAGAELVAGLANEHVEKKGSFHVVVSGGRTPWTMLAALSKMDVPWEAVTIYQVDERVAPDGDPDRNLTLLERSLGDAASRVEPMPVAVADLEAACDRYADVLPSTFDLVHLGLGSDGHTASLVPGDPVLAVTDRLVALTNEYQGRRRMTLTFPALARAAEVLWLVAGEDKHDALARMLDGDVTIPAGRVDSSRAVVLADDAAL